VLRKKRATPKYLTDEQVERFFQAIQKPAARHPERDRAMFRLALCRGLRASEIGLLQLVDFRAKAERIWIHRKKGSKSGEYPLLPGELRPLKAWLKIRGNEPGPLFPSERGTGISQQMLDVLVKRYGKIAGIPREQCQTRAFRHSCGTHLVSRGEDIAIVQDWLGHVNIMNTMIYVEIANPTRNAAAERQRGW
jgi:integrase